MSSLQGAKAVPIMIPLCLAHMSNQILIQLLHLHVIMLLINTSAITSGIKVYKEVGASVNVNSLSKITPDHITVINNGTNNDERFN